MESFEEYARREGHLSPKEFREIQMLHASPDVIAVICKILREQSESERVSAIGARGKQDPFVHLGAWKALQRAADFIHNRVSDFDYMISEFATQSVESQ